MYKEFDTKRNEHKQHVEVLAASIRSLDHFYASIFLGADIVTIPMTIIREWIEQERWVPDEKYRIDTEGLHAILYKEFPYHDDYTQYEVKKEEGSLLDEGLNKFVQDWNNLLDK